MTSVKKNYPPHTIDFSHENDDASKQNSHLAITNSLTSKLDDFWRTIRRILWPLKPQSAYSRTSDGTLPIEYQNVLDPLDVLVYVAANTSTIKLGTSVIDMFYYTPIMLAKRLLPWIFFTR